MWKLLGFGCLTSVG